MLALLLVMAGIETNPGPTVADVSRRLDELFTEIRAMRADLTTKIADCAVDLTLKMQAFEQQVVLFTARLDAVERAQLAMRADIDTLMSSSITGTGHSSSSAPVATTTADFATSTAVDDLVRERDWRSSRKINIVLSGLKLSLAGDAEIVKNLLHNDLHIDTTVTRCVRVGQAQPDRPKLLIATLASEMDARAAIRSATLLRKSISPKVRNNVFLNADLTKEQCSTEFKLRAELKRRRLLGELNLVIRDGRVITKPSARSSTHAPGQQSSSPQSSSPTLHASPSLVALPAASAP